METEKHREYWTPDNAFFISGGYAYKVMESGETVCVATEEEILTKYPNLKK